MEKDNTISSKNVQEMADCCVQTAPNWAILGPTASKYDTKTFKSVEYFKNGDGLTKPNAPHQKHQRR